VSSNNNNSVESQIGMSMPAHRFIYFWAVSGFKIGKGKWKLFFEHILFFVFTLWLYPALYLYEKLFLRRKIKDVALTKDPVFVIGHWRSGTTFLHYLLSQDPNFSHLTILHASTYPYCLAADKSDFIKTEFAKAVPEYRPMDKVPMSSDSAFEDEYPLLYSHNSFYLGWIFPKMFERAFDRYLMFGNDSVQAKRWKKRFKKVIQKLNFLYKGKQLLLKNPVNTARIKLILDIFPNAKFIYIKRDPYKVFHSTMRLHQKMCADSGIQGLEEVTNRRCVLKFYNEVINKYLQERSLIPAGNLVEIRYEDLVASPFPTLTRIYSELSLSGFDQAKGHFNDYLSSTKNYKVSQYEPDQQVYQELRSTWCTGFEDWEQTGDDAARVFREAK
jgi:hypothetical protein